MENLLGQGKQINHILIIISFHKYLNIYYQNYLDSEENYKESIVAILNSLIEEKKNEVQKVEDEYRAKVNEIKEEYTRYNIRGESEVQLLEEKFKLEIYNSVGNMFNLKQIKLNISIYQFIKGSINLII